MAYINGTEDNTIYGAYGEFVPANMTDEEWAAYDAQVAADIAEDDARKAREYEAFLDVWPDNDDDQPPF